MLWIFKDFSRVFLKFSKLFLASLKAIHWNIQGEKCVEVQLYTSYSDKVYLMSAVYYGLDGRI